MTPPAAATAAARSDARRIRRSPAGAPPRRVSGPRSGTRDPRAAAATRLQAAPALAPSPHARTRRPAVATGVGTLSLPGRGIRAVARSVGGREQSYSVLDRLLSSRAWIALVAGLLIGLVFLQVTLLKVNAGIGDTVQQANALQRSNDAYRSEISVLRQDERITAAATKLGMVMPQPDQVRYLGGKAGGVGGAGGIATTADDASAAADGSSDPGAVTDGSGATDTSGDTTDTSGDTTDTSGDATGATDTSGDTSTDSTATDTRVGDTTDTSGDTSDTSGDATSDPTSQASDGTGDATTGGAAAPTG